MLGEIPSISRLLAQVQQSRTQQSPAMRQSQCHGFYGSLIDDEFRRREKERHKCAAKAEQLRLEYVVQSREVEKKPFFAQARNGKKEKLFDGVPDWFDFPSLARDVSVLESTYARIQQEIAGRIAEIKSGGLDYEALFGDVLPTVEDVEERSEAEEQQNPARPGTLLQEQPVKMKESAEEAGKRQQQKQKQVELSAHLSAVQEESQAQPQKSMEAKREADVIDIQKILVDETGDTPVDELDEIEAQYELQSSMQQPAAEEEGVISQALPAYPRTTARQTGEKTRWELGKLDSEKEILRSNGQRLTELQRAVNAKKYRDGEEKQKAESRRTQIAIDSFKQYQQTCFLNEPKQAKEELAQQEEFNAYDDQTLAHRYRGPIGVEKIVPEPSVFEKESLKRTRVYMNKKVLDPGLKDVVKRQKREIAELQNALAQIESDPNLIQHLKASQHQPALTQNFSSQNLIQRGARDK